MSEDGDQMIANGRRRIAQLLALEQQRNSKGKQVIISSNTNASSDEKKGRKRGRKRKIEHVHEATGETALKGIFEEARKLQEGTGNSGSTTIIPFSSPSQRDRLIRYIIDLFEVKDKHELFSIPDNIEAYAYAERLSLPGDFATLRLKHENGMYKTLEQFESDVYMVYRKAIDSNPPHSVPYKEAQSLQKHAKQIFRSLRKNPAYVELELSTWHENYFDSRRNAAGQICVGCPDRTEQPESSSHQELRKKTQGNVECDVGTVGRGLSISPKSWAASKPRGKRVKVE